MKIALAQMRVRAASPRGNLTGLREYIGQARMQGAHVLLAPEMSIPGYLVGDAWERRGFLAEIAYAHEELARASAAGEFGDLTLVFGSLGVDPAHRNEDGRPRKANACLVLRGGRYGIHPTTGLPFFPKALSPEYREFDDSRHFFDARKEAFERGAPLLELVRPIDAGGFPAGACLCEDGWDDDYAHAPLSLLAAQGARALFNLSCSPYTFGKRDKRVRLFTGKARALGLPLFYVNAVGVQNVGKTVFGFDGGSLVVSRDGAVIYEGGFYREELATFAFDPDSGSVEHVLTTPRADFASAPPGAAARFATASLPRDAALERLVALENIVALTCEEWGLSRAVVGVSGGIDSALSATLFSRVLGPAEVSCVTMPSRFNSHLTRTAARALAAGLGSPFLEAPIQASVDLTLAELAGWRFEGGARAREPAITTLLEENVQARDRSARVLSALAAGLGAVFPCNANKAEATVGYSTLYGDQSGFLAPLADLWKHEVYGLARAYNENVYGREVIPRATLDVVPSAELSEAQDVTAGRGDPIAYPYHDFLFRSWVERWERLDAADCLEFYLDGSLEGVIGCERGLVARLFPSPAEFVADLERWWRAYVGMGAYKRVQAPPVVALSRRAFGFDHREHVGPCEFGARYAEMRARALGTRASP